jgi:hypothetical protein
MGLFPKTVRFRDFCAQQGRFMGKCHMIEGFSSHFHASFPGFIRMANPFTIDGLVIGSPNRLFLDGKHQKSPFSVPFS